MEDLQPNCSAYCPQNTEAIRRDLDLRGCTLETIARYTKDTREKVFSELPEDDRQALRGAIVLGSEANPATCGVAGICQFIASQTKARIRGRDEAQWYADANKKLTGIY
jgi:hypothetical protein